MATVTMQDGTTREVKNLGWILRHADEVLAIDVQALAGGGAEFVATLDEGRQFRITFGSARLALEFAQRRRFGGVPLSFREA